VPHGFFLMRLYYLRGFENLMLDIASEEPKLDALIRMVHGYNRARVEKWLSLGVEYFEFAEDLGTQTASLISPAAFARYVEPRYRELFSMCHAKGALTWLHSDGHILEIADQLIAAGADVLNPQDLCNGIDELARIMKGRVCIDLDIDRQKVVPFGTRAEIRELIEEEVRKLGSAEGGLKFTVGFYPPTPPANIDAVLSALEEFRCFFR
jgi:uroporphyrinogen-III decarboxylase